MDHIHRQIEDDAPPATCGLRAIAHCTRSSYHKVELAFLNATEWQWGQPTFVEYFPPVLKRLGFEYIDCSHLSLKHRTIRTLARHLNPRCTYLIITTSHALAWADGKIQDWADGRLHRIENVWRITPQ